MHIMHIRNSAFPKGVIHIIKTLKKHGFSAYAVGGALRDILLKIPTDDFDITTSARPQTIMKLFKKAIPTGIKYGTVTVILPDGKFEVTTFRADEAYSDGRRPDRVLFTKNITDDLSRRDFTINAIAYDPITKELVDPFGGQKDLKKKLIRTVGKPKDRFLEDGLRPFRACRFAAKLNFKIEPKTFAAIRQTLRKAKVVSPERIREELVKLLGAKKPSVGLELMRRSGLLKIALPELERGFGIPQNEFHKYDIYWHNILSCDAAPPDITVVRMAALLHDISKPECKDGPTFYGHEQVGCTVAARILKRLRFSNADSKKILNLIRCHMFDYTRNWSDAAVRRFIRRVGLENIADLFVLRQADLAAMGRKTSQRYLPELQRRILHIVRAENALKLKDLAIDGHDIMKYLKLKPGPIVGKILNELLEKVLDNPKLNTRKSLLSIAKSVEGIIA